MNDTQRKKRLDRLRKSAEGKTDSITIKATHGMDYTVTRQGDMFSIWRPTPDGEYIHRVLWSKYDALKVANAIVDLYERDAAT